MRRLPIQLGALMLVWLSVLPAIPALATALTNTTNLSVPADFAVSISCANEGTIDVVRFSGNLHVLFHVTISDSGHILLEFHFQPQGISGTGQITGGTYHVVGVTEGTTSFDFVTGFPFEASIVNNFGIIGNGPITNARVHENFHVTINANAEVTAVLDNVHITCDPALP